MALENAEVETGQEDQSIDLRAQIEGAMREVKERTETSATERDATERADRTRDDRGRFAARQEQAEPETPTPTAAPAPAQTTEQPAQVAQTPAQPAGVKAPESAPPEVKALFDKLPPEVQGWVAKREAEVHRQFTRQDEERNFGKSMKDVVTPYLPMIQAEGGNPVAAVQNLLNTAYILRHAPIEQKTEAVKALIQQYGIDATTLAQPQAYVDPTVAQLQRQLAEIENRDQQREQFQQQQQTQAMQAELQAFAADPKNQHYEQVKPHMAALLSAGLVTSLQDAYDQAVWARPDLRSNLLTAQSRQAEDQRVAEAKARADAARKAGSSINGGPGAPASGGPRVERSLRDELAANFAAAQGRV